MKSSGRPSACPNFVLFRIFARGGSFYPPPSQIGLNKARSKVDFAIAEQVYMLPSDMLLKIGDIKDYNNNLLIANNSVKIGVVNQSVNVDVKHVIKSLIIHKTSTPSMLPEKDKKLAVDHIEEKEVLIIAGISVILFVYYFI